MPSSRPSLGLSFSFFLYPADRQPGRGMMCAVRAFMSCRAVGLGRDYMHMDMDMDMDMLGSFFLPPPSWARTQEPTLGDPCLL